MPLQKARLRISDYNENRKRKNGQFERGVRNVSLSLTSMVDMFAILVIFLIAQSDNSQWLSLAHGIDLPKGKFASPPPRGPTLQIAKDAVYSDTGPIVGLDKMMTGPDIVDSVQKYLNDQPKKDTFVNVVADKKVPFGAIRRIVASAQAAGFTNVNLAVQPH